MKKISTIFFGTFLAFTFLFTSNVSAHVKISPTQAQVGTTQTFIITVPSEELNKSTTSIRLVLPSGLEEVTPTTKLGWSLSIKKDESGNISEITWSDGKIPSEEQGTFSFSAKVPSTSTILKWKAYQTYSDGSVVSWDQDSSSADENSTPYSKTEVIDDLSSNEQSTSNLNDSGTRNLALFALIIAIISLGFSASSFYIFTKRKN